MFVAVSMMVHFAGIQRTLKEQKVIENEVSSYEVSSYERHIQQIANIQRHAKEQRIKENERIANNRGKQ